MDFFTAERLKKARMLAQDGKPFIFDDGDMRTLHFDEHMVQSAMLLSAPDDLVVCYTQAMSGFSCFIPEPQHILMVGLGGGSLLKYCFRRWPHVRITVLELNADVIALRDQFMIPPDDARLQILHIDAALYLQQVAAASVDVILLDGFDVNGAPADLRTYQFFSHCKRALCEQGVLVTNMGDDDTEILATITQGRAVFGIPHLWWFKTRVEYSHVAVMLNAVTDEAGDAVLHQTALRMGEQFSLEMIYPKKPPQE